MAKVQLEKLINDCKKCKKTMTIADITDTYIQAYSLLYNEGTALKRIEKKLGEEDFNIFITSLMSTFLTNIYVNNAFDNIEDAIKYGAQMGANKVGIATIKKEKK